MEINFKQKLQRPGFSYPVIGGSVYLLELAIIFGAEAAGKSAVFSVGLSFWVGLIVSFFLQKTVTFSDRRMHHRVLIPQAVAYSCLVLFNFGFTLLVTALLTPAIPAAITRTLALGATTIWNFYLYKAKIFKGPLIVQ